MTGPTKNISRLLPLNDLDVPSSLRDLSDERVTYTRSETLSKQLVICADLRGSRVQQLTQTRGPPAEVSRNSAAAASVALTDAALVQGVGGEQHPIASNRLRRKWRTDDKVSQLKIAV